MADVKKTAEAAVAEVKATEKAAEKKVAEKKAPAAKKAAAPKKAAEKKTATKKAAVEELFVESLGAQINVKDLITRAKKESGIKSPKSVKVYVKFEENKVYYVIDEKQDCFFLV